MRSATSRKPAFSIRARMCPALPAFTASGLMMENVLSVNVSLDSYNCAFVVITS